ncbi:MAG TPA: hypothetical protein K8W22_06005, partial [Gordonibacter urolithinfaciens]|uniref:hypothetical protein n=1 Tax=Gordonibacter urolithinfaciens TaxID=1335613 RepID=UPI001D3E33E8
FLSVLRLREEGKAQTAMATVRNPHLHDLCKTGGEVFTYENSIYVLLSLYTTWGCILQGSLQS